VPVREPTPLSVGGASKPSALKNTPLLKVLLPAQQAELGTLKPTWLAQTAAEATVLGRVLVRDGATGDSDGGAPADAGASTGRSSDAQGAKH